MKKPYESAKWVLLMLEEEDLLTASDDGGEIETDPNELPII